MNSVQQARRILTGHCRSCGSPIVVLNNHEVWPYIECHWCGDRFATTELANRHRIEEGFVVNNNDHPRAVKP